MQLFLHLFRFAITCTHKLHSTTIVFCNRVGRHVVANPPATSTSCEFTHSVRTTGRPAVLDIRHTELQRIERGCDEKNTTSKREQSKL